VGEGELIALLGPNGAGKTSMLRVALGLSPVSQGRVLLGDRDVTGLSARERAAALAWLPQHGLSTEPLSVLEVVRAARFRFDESRRESQRMAEQSLERVSASGLRAARITELSGGERQRVFFASLLAQGARGLLLDEPASHLDPAQQLETYRLLGELWREGLSIVLVTHDVNLLSELGSEQRVRIAGLSQGRLEFETNYAAVDLAECLGRLFKVRFMLLEHAGRRLVFADRSPASLEASG
jgi:iron complex transport system ATP-binding protein